ncbi:hypothetical protein ACSBR1_040338 [Camellia fascicularis]
MASDEVPIPDPTIGIGATLGADMEGDEAVALLSLTERPFDAATYRPRTHVVARRVSGYGSISSPLHWHERLPTEVPVAVDAAGFGPFCLGLIQMRAESWLYGALVERWWDTTDSFHFSSTGEMTLTPYDFSMLIGALVHLSQVAEYDWGGTSLAILYCYMSSVSPYKADSLGSYWRVWELWMYTYFTSLAPVPVRPIELLVPRSRYYNSRFERHRLVDRTFPYFRCFFDMITAD